MADLCSFCVSFSLCAAGAVAAPGECVGWWEGQGLSVQPGLSGGGPAAAGAAHHPTSCLLAWSVRSPSFPAFPGRLLWQEGHCLPPSCRASASPPSWPAGRSLSPFPLFLPLQTMTVGTTATRRAAATPAPATSSSATVGAASLCTGPAMGTMTAGTTVTRLMPTAPTRVSPSWAAPVLLLSVLPRGPQVLPWEGGRERASSRWTLSSAAVLPGEPKAPPEQSPRPLSSQAILQLTAGAQITPLLHLWVPLALSLPFPCQAECPVLLSPPEPTPFPAPWGKGSERVCMPSHQQHAHPGAATLTSSSAGWTGSASPCAGAATATRTAWTPVTRRTARGSPMSVTPTSSLAVKTQVRAGEGGTAAPCPL